MMKPDVPEEETRIVKTAIGYSWSYSFESGPSGDRQKLILTGNAEGMTRALTELKKAKISLLELSQASLEELIKPPGFEAYEKEKEPLY